MTVRVALRLAFTAQPPTIHCSACGEEANQAGIAVEPSAITTKIVESGGSQSVVDVSNAQPLCEACTKLLMTAQQG